MSNRPLLLGIALLALCATHGAEARPKPPGATPPAIRDQAWARHKDLVEHSLFGGLS